MAGLGDLGKSFGTIGNILIPGSGRNKGGLMGMWSKIADPIGLVAPSKKPVIPTMPDPPEPAPVVPMPDPGDVRARAVRSRNRARSRSIMSDYGESETLG